MISYQAGRMFFALAVLYDSSLFTLRRRYSSSSPTTAGNSTTASVSVSVASRDECDDQPLKSKLDDDGTSLWMRT